MDPSGDMDTEEEYVHSPPPSLVPRVHVIVANKLEHNNPLLPTDLKGLNEKQGNCICFIFVIVRT